MRIQRSAMRHGIGPEDIEHAWDFAMQFFDLDTDNDTSKGLCIGPDCAGNPLEVIYRRDDNGVTVIHAMRLRPVMAAYLRRPRP